MKSEREKNGAGRKREKMEARDLDPKFTAAVVPASSSSSMMVLSPANEKAQLAAVLTKTRGNRSEAARLLNMPRRTFYRKLEKFGLL